MGEQEHRALNIPSEEEKVLAFWEREEIFAKSIARRHKRPHFSFYDGPPFATGKPHYGHILATTIKDTVTRYWTMRGYLVARRVGWDTHGLPVETLVEKELGIKSKREIIKLGVEKFNAACRSVVFRSVQDFQATLKRVGRWADYEHSYATLDMGYMESVWWVFKQIHDRGLLYQDFRITPYCPRCATPLSNFEVNQGYRETTDPSIYVKFPMANGTWQMARGKKPRHALRATRDVPTFFLVWTTTPWTLPANVALAVHPRVTYVRVERKVGTGKHEQYILAQARLLTLGSGWTVKERIQGKDLIGRRYEPLYRFFPKENPPHHIIAGEFVSTEEGTGIVHIAPAFGEDDLAVARKEHLPILAAVDEEGRFVEGVTPWTGRPVKACDPDIIKDLKIRGLLAREEKIRHQYPFCWRCDHYLIYYAAKSWYIAVTKVKKELVQNNKRIHWVPAHIGRGRFGKWLEGARDWAVSRNRFWGTPLPIWQCRSCKERRVFGGVTELARAVPGNVTLIAVRHGESTHNIENICNGDPEKKFPLTARGRRQAGELARLLAGAKIDRIVTSRFMRALETTEIINAKRNVPVLIDDRLSDTNFGVYEGREWGVCRLERINAPNQYTYQFPRGESLAMVEERMGELVKDLERRFPGERILAMSHEDPLKALFVHFGWEQPHTMHRARIPPASFRVFETAAPHDLHRPAIDAVKPRCEKCGGEMQRIPEVFDCWFESGAMPYAQWHYPFEYQERVEQTFPADFIAEGLDQTRGWFYTLHVLATILTKKDIGLGRARGAFKNVIVNGLILDPEGKKLSKRLANYPEPDEVFTKYGADALRLFLLSSTQVGEDYRFSEQGVRETFRSAILPLVNILSFAAMVGRGDRRATRMGPRGRTRGYRDHILDRWILAEQGALIREVTRALDAYDLTRAVRPILQFIGDLSTWYLRRSRERLKAGDARSRVVLWETLEILAQLLAPFAPFLAEILWQHLGHKGDSVHLTDWPTYRNIDLSKFRNIRKQMERVRRLAEAGHALRKERNIKVRQPLSTFAIRGPLAREWGLVLADEMHVKEVRSVSRLPRGAGWVRREGKEIAVALDTTVTPALAEEGTVRELIRQVNALRKEHGLRLEDRIEVHVVAGDAELRQLVERANTQLLATLRADRIVTVTAQKEEEMWVPVVEAKLSVAIRRVEKRV